VQNSTKSKMVDVQRHYEKCN